MTNLFGTFKETFNKAAGNYGEKSSAIDPAKLTGSIDRLAILIAAEEVNRAERLARLEESAEKLRQATNNLMNRDLEPAEDMTAAFQKRDDDCHRARVAGVQKVMARGTTQQVSAPQTARFRTIR